MKEETSSKPEILTSTSGICRDYLRNVCNRSKRCKFRHCSLEDLEHLSVDTAKDPGSSNVTYEFCHDFQNIGCDRHNCKFIHCTKEVEVEFQETGILPLKLKYEFELGVGESSGQLKPETVLEVKTVKSAALQEKMKPICRDYAKRQCRRGKKCRFVHLDQNSNIAENELCRTSVQLGSQNQNRSVGNDADPDKKRLRLIQGGCLGDRSVFSVPSEGDVTKNITCLVTTPSASTIQFIKEENLMLRKEVDNLRKQVSDLSATNEVLLEQNAQFRLQKRCYAESVTPSFSQAKNYGTQSPLSVSVPIAMSLNVPGQTQQMAGSAGLAGASLLTSDPLTVTPVEIVNSSQAQQSLNTVNVVPRAAVPGQARIQISRSMQQNNTGLVNNIVTNNSQLIDELHSLTSGNVGPNPGSLHANITPVLQQTNLAGQTVASFSITQNTIPISQNLNCTVPSMTTCSASGPLMQNPHPSIITGSSAMTLNQTQGTQNIAAGGLVVQANRNITVEADEDSIGHINRNIANAQMTRATLVTNTQQNQTNGAPGSLSASIAAVAAQVIAQGSLQQANNEIGTTQISVPAVPCGTLASAIVPVTIMPSLSINNSPGGLLATRIQGVAGAHSGGARVSMVTTCPPTVVSMSPNPGHQVVNGLNGRPVVRTQQQLNAPINFTINPAQQAGPGMHA